MLGINVFYTTKPGMAEDFLARIAQAGVREAVLQEAGCLGYDYYRSAHQPDRVLLVEKWTDQEAQKVHLSQPHMAALRAIKEDCVAETELDLYQL